MVKQDTVLAAACIWPLLAMAGLTFLALGWLGYFRLVSRTMPIGYYKVSDPKYGTPPPAEMRAQKHLSNLFEFPVLFYVVGVLSALLKLDDPLHINLMWGYVALRVGHSVIFCSYNNVLHRFGFFATSVNVLAVLWVRVALALV